MGRIEQLFRMDDAVAVVSGGAGLIGAKLCEIFAQAGAHVVMVDNNPELAESEAARVSEQTGRRVIFKTTDVADEPSVKRLGDDVYREFGRCDVLVNAAHYSGPLTSSLGEYPLEAWKKVLEVNLTGTFLMCRELGSRMYEGDGGVIVNISSIYGLVSADPRIYGECGLNSTIAYAASKSGLINMTRYIAVHWRPKVRANVLAPGGVEADLDAEFVNNYCYRVPLGRMARRDEFQGTILFMCSDASSYMTGAVVCVDGGWTAW